MQERKTFWVCLSKTFLADGIFNKFGEEKSRHSKDKLAAEISDESEIIRQTHIEKSVKVKRLDLNNEIMDSSDALQVYWILDKERFKISFEDLYERRVRPSIGPSVRLFHFIYTGGNAIFSIN